MAVVVRGRDVAALGVVLARQVAAEALPLVVARARDRQTARPSITIGREAADLQSNVPRPVAADHVVRRGLPEHRAIEEIFTARGLRQLQAALEGRRPRFLVHRLRDIGAMARDVLVKRRTVTRELQLDETWRRFALDLD